MLLTGVEPGQDTLSGTLQQQGAWVGPLSSLSAFAANVKEVSSTHRWRGNFDFQWLYLCKDQSGQQKMDSEQWCYSAEVKKGNMSGT